jgi:hypothetical protein
VLVGASAPGFCYEVTTHEDLSQAALTQSDLSNPAKLQQIGLRALDLDDARQTFPSATGGTPRTILSLVKLGSRYEDDLGVAQAKFQPLRHFYDPVNDRGLDVGGAIGASTSIRSPDWALEDLVAYNGSPGPLAFQDFSIADARRYLYDALTSLNPIVRKSNLGLTFQSLGHVIHHLQDMAQPQHVRNDPHCDQPVCGGLARELGVAQLYSPSAYEKYTDLDDPNIPYGRIRTSLPFSGNGSSATYPGAGSTPSPFVTARKFWRTTAVGDDIATGKGIAEYTNRNFFSAGTIRGYNSPPSPAGSVSTYFTPTSEVDISELLGSTTLTGKVRFWSSTVSDMLSGAPAETNERALSEGILDSDLVKYHSTAAQGYLVYALNRFTFDAAHKFLIPRAVGYSAGLINFFFRGQLEITPPDEGVYGIVDHTIENRRDIDGFGKIKLKLRNVTSGGTDAQGRATIEPIPDNSPGTLVAVVKFHRNTCYTPSLSGEYGSPGVAWSNCRSPTEEIVVSSPMSAPPNINTDPQLVEFTFQNKVPINASDVFLQVVYRGPLGGEADAVMVATRDIAEPLFLTQFSVLDQFTYSGFPSLDPGNLTFEQWCAGGYPSYDACRAAEGATLKLRFGPAPGFAGASGVEEGVWKPLTSEPPFTPVATMVAPVGTYARVALLADGAARHGIYVWERFASMGAIFQWNAVTLTGNFNQLNFGTGTLTPSDTYVAGRGIYIQSASGSLLNSGTGGAIPNLSPSPSSIAF